jgi:hypothetical protein
MKAANQKAVKRVGALQLNALRLCYVTRLPIIAIVHVVRPAAHTRPTMMRADRTDRSTPTLGPLREVIFVI